MLKKKISKQVHLTCLLFILFSIFTHAQTIDYSIKWDTEVGCVNFHDPKDPKEDRDRNGNEGIEPAECPQVCENAVVYYYVNTTSYQSIQWSVAGGIINGSATSSQIAVDWGGRGNGQVSVAIVNLQGQLINYVQCIEIIAKPKAEFLINNSTNYEFCDQTTLYFNNLSSFNGGSALYSYYWEFSDGTTSSEFEPSKVFSGPGDYSIKLTVTNECHCSESYEMKIKIIDTKAPVIKCPTVVCDSDTATYTTDDQCSVWEVIGGTIVSNNGNSIDVIWDSVDESGFGYVILKSDCECQLPVVEKIPVITTETKIVGPEILCLNESFTFSIPQWPTTEVNWTLSPQLNGNDLQITDQRNEINVTLVNPGVYTLTANYYNTLLQCGGTAVKEIHVKDKTIISGVNKVCQFKQNVVYTTNSGLNTQWLLTKNGNIVNQHNGNSFTYDFNIVGVFKLIASSPDFCISDEFIIEVIPQPETPTGVISGDTRICPTRVYNYTFTNTDPYSNLEWMVTNGVIIGSNMGPTIAVDFDDNATSFSVKVRRVSKDPLGCKSQYLELPVEIDTIVATITNSQNINNFCPSTITSFSTNLQVGVNVDEIYWEIINPNNSPSLGNITSGATNVSTVNVLFNESSSSNYQGIVKLNYRKCDVWYSQTFNFTVKYVPNITLNNINTVCAGSQIFPTLNYPLNSLNSGMISWSLNGTPVGNSTISNGSFLVPYIIPQNTSGVAQTQTLTAFISNINGCDRTLTLTKSFTVLPDANIRVSPGANIIVCSNVANWSQTFIVNYIGNGTIQFFNASNDQQVISNSSQIVSGNTITVNTTTAYYAKVTLNGCVYTSDVFKVTVQNCPPANCIAPDYYVSSSYIYTCDQVKINNIFNGTVNSHTWEFNTSKITLNSNSLTSSTFTIHEPGEHVIKLHYVINGCLFTKQLFVVKDFKPDFYTTVSCNNINGTSTVTINDSSIYYNQPTTKQIRVGTFGLWNTLNYPYTVNLAPGSHQISIRYTRNGITCTTTKTITVYGLPNSNFNSSSMQACYDGFIEFNPIQSAQPGYTYVWSFNGSQNTQHSPKLQLAVGTNISVTLTVTNPNGCSTSTTKAGYIVNKPNFLGSITGGGQFCEGSSTQLAFVPLSSSTPATSYQWYYNGQPINGATSINYTPLQTGSYSVGAFDVNNCFRTVDAAINVAFKPKPFININGPEQVCRYTNFELFVNTIANAQVRVRYNNGSWSNWTTNTNYSFNLSNVGNHSYTFEVRDPLDPNCTNSFTKTITVVSPPTIHDMGFSIENCDPYKVKIWVNGSNYTNIFWSDGQSGSDIVVNQGGAYQVTLTNAQGCEVTQTIFIPKDPNVYTWIFPTGCVTICPEDGAYLIGPSPNVFFYPSTWANTSVGNYDYNYGVTPDNTNIKEGQNYLFLNNGTCEVNSDKLCVKVECGEKKCDVRYRIKPLKCDKNEFSQFIFIFDLIADNPHGVDVYASLNSPVGYFIPSNFVIPANSGTVQQVIFVANTPFNYMFDYTFIFQNGSENIRCRYSEQIHMERLCAQTNYKLASAMTLYPNPTTNATTAKIEELDITEPTFLEVYNMIGIKVHQAKVTSLTNNVIPTYNWPAGNYIVVIKQNNEIKLQTHLIKK